MEQAELFQILSLGCFGLGGILLIGAVVLFFRLRVPEICGELSGRSARKQIEAYRAQMEGEADKKSRKKTARKQAARKQTVKKSAGKAADATEVLGAMTADATEVLESAAADATEVLGAMTADATEVLESAAADATEVLGAPEQDATEVLGASDSRRAMG